MILHHRYIFLLLLFVLLGGLDQYSKWWVIEEFIGYDDPKNFLEWLIATSQATRPFDYKIITPFLNIVVVWNEGISFGLFHDAGEWIRVALIVLATGISGFFVFLLSQAQKPLPTLSLMFVIIGALSNVWDRVRFGAVADFLDFHVAGWHYPAFNLADSLIVIGVFGYLTHEVFLNKKP